MRITDTHYYFWNTIYSQWYKSNRKTYLFEENDIKFYSSEHYMMYHKCLTFNDEVNAKTVLQKTSPREVKAIGRQIKNYDDNIWSEKRYDIVLQGNILKFSQNEELLEDLNKYKDKIFVEASPEDNIWGIGLHYDDDRVLDESQWEGQNLLGKVINDVAKRLCKKDK